MVWWAVGFQTRTGNYSQPVALSDYLTGNSVIEKYEISWKKGAQYPGNARVFTIGTFIQDKWISTRRICSGFSWHNSLNRHFRPEYFSSTFSLSPYRTGVEPSSLITVRKTNEQPSKKDSYEIESNVKQSKNINNSMLIPMISRCIELSIGRGSDRKLNGSKRALTCPQVLHLTCDLSWPWNRSTTIERFLLRWFSQAWRDTKMSSEGIPVLLYLNI